MPIDSDLFHSIDDEVINTVDIKYRQACEYLKSKNLDPSVEENLRRHAFHYILNKELRAKLDTSFERCYEAVAGALAVVLGEGDRFAKLLETPMGKDSQEYKDAISDAMTLVRELNQREFPVHIPSYWELHREQLVSAIKAVLVRCGATEQDANTLQFTGVVDINELARSILNEYSSGSHARIK